MIRKMTPLASWPVTSVLTKQPSLSLPSENRKKIKPKAKNLEYVSTILPKEEKQLRYHRFFTGKQGGCPQEKHSCSTKRQE